MPIAPAATSLAIWSRISRSCASARRLLPLLTDQPAEDRAGAAVERAARDDVHASHGPRCREAEVDRRTALRFARVRAIDGRAAGFELERGRDAVARLQPPSGKRLRVAVQVDEARRDDEPVDVDRRRPVERVADRGDAPAVDADVALPVEPGLRIEHPPTRQDQSMRQGNSRFRVPWRPATVENLRHSGRRRQQRAALLLAEPTPDSERLADAKCVVATLGQHRAHRADFFRRLRAFVALVRGRRQPNGEQRGNLQAGRALLP